MAVSKAAGVQIYIGTTATTAATDTYTHISNVVTVPAFGRSYNDIKFVTHDDGGATQHFKGSYDDGMISVPLGKDATDAGQILVIAALADGVSDYNFKIVAPDQVAAASAIGVSMTAATPGVVTDTAHGLAVNTPIKLVPISAGVLPTGIVSGTTYYVKTVASVDTYTLSATSGGTVINTTGSPSGTYTRTTVPAGTYQLLKAKVMSYTTEYGGTEDVIKATMNLGIKSGTIVETARIPTA
jgi:hypothetical protein